MKELRQLMSVISESWNELESVQSSGLNIDLYVGKIEKTANKMVDSIPQPCRKPKMEKCYWTQIAKQVPQNSWLVKVKTSGGKCIVTLQS